MVARVLHFGVVALLRIARKRYVYIGMNSSKYNISSFIFYTCIYIYIYIYIYCAPAQSALEATSCRPLRAKQCTAQGNQVMPSMSEGKVLLKTTPCRLSRAFLFPSSAAQASTGGTPPNADTTNCRAGTARSYLRPVPAQDVVLALAPAPKERPSCLARNMYLPPLVPGVRGGLLTLLALIARTDICTARDHIRHNGAASHRS